MKMKTLLFSFLFFSLITHAQDSSFQLKDYKYRTDGYRALNFGIRLSSQTKDSKAFNDSLIKSRSFSLDGLSISYDRVMSTDKRIHYSYISLSPSFSINKSEGYGTKGVENTSRNYSSWYFNNRFYGKNKWFLELGNRLFARYFITENKENTVRENSGDFYVDNEFNVGFGKGRIEYVQDAQMALFIINDLKKQGLISSDVNAETINQFAQLITEINNKRIFDNRKKRIYELTQINNFLKEKGLISEPDIRHFTTINDNWTLAFNSFRSSGSAWFARLNPNIKYNKINREFANNGYKYVQKSFGYSPEIGYGNSKPINLKWQRDFGGSIRYSSNKIDAETQFLSGTPSNQKTNHVQSEIFVQSYYGISYYPNNRTLLYTTLSLLAGEQKWDYNSVERNKYLKPTFNFNTDYFISYRTRLNISLLVYAQFNENGVLSSSSSSLTKNQVNTSFNLSLSHSFF